MGNAVTRARPGRTPARPVLLVLAALAGLAQAAPAQDPKPPAEDPAARIERLEKEVRELKDLMKPPAGKAGEPAKPAPDDPAKAAGTVVGEDTKYVTTWDAGGFRFRTADGAFSVHLGGRLMSDEVWWTQSPGLRAPAAPPPGSPLGGVTGVGPGVGDLLDGFFIRRARFVADGTIYQTVEFKTEFDFENYNSIAFDESFIGARDLPAVDTVRLGQTHVPFGLEAYTSSRFLPLMERSPLFDAFYQEFGPGVFTDTTFLDQRVTTQHMFHRVDAFNQFNGASFGDGKYAYSGRVSGLPVYEADGRCLLHLGLAYQFRKGTIPLDFNGGTAEPAPPGPGVAGTTDLVRFRARPSLRDAVGAQGNGARAVDTGNIIADHVQAVNGELMGYLGPVWLQSEACVARVANAAYPAAAGAARAGDLTFYGTYAQVGWLVTGEARGYDRRFGKYDRVRPLENFFLVRDEGGRARYGLGAWEFIYRYGYVNLSDGPVQGGAYGEHTVGMNWYWNSNTKIQCNYLVGQRAVPAGAAGGVIQGFGIRAALEF